MNLFNKIIQNLGKDNYELDRSLSMSEVMCEFSYKGFDLLRGLLLRIRVHRSEGWLFVGRRCKIKHAHKISLGKTIVIGDYVVINALSKEGIKIGNNLTIGRNTIIECTGVLRALGEGIEIGNNVGIAQNTFIQVRGKVKIGSNVILGPGVSIFSENHNISDPEKQIIEQGETRKGVTIEDNVWIGANSTILDGVCVGTGSVIAAGSVVTKNVERYSVVGGVPARLIKKRK
jgi:acetyltransferase-like isoleucine patch superfamily enzyme